MEKSKKAGGSKETGSIEAFLREVERELGGGDPVGYTVEPKIDGIPIEMVYETGSLVRASWMRDGNTGEDITACIKTILDVPLSLVPIPGSRPIPNRLAVKGEIYMEAPDFETLNRQRLESGMPPFASPRDAAEGSLAEMDYRVTARRRLRVFCSGMTESNQPPFDTRMGLMKTLQEWGLRVNRPHLRSCPSGEAVIEACRDLENNREQFPFFVDGALIQVDSLSVQARLGQAEGRPRWAMVHRFGRG